MIHIDPNYVPAFGLRWLTPYYDSFAKFVNPLRRRLIQQANIQPGQRVLDVGCGTGLLTMMIKRSIPEASVTGLDGDEEVLTIARKKKPTAHELRFNGIMRSPPICPILINRLMPS